MSEKHPSSQEGPCWLCELEGGTAQRCLYHVMVDIPSKVREALVDRESMRQNRAEWEERALKAEAQLAALSSSQSEQGWRPISTAPKDGTEIWLGGDGWRTTFCQWCEAGWVDEDGISIDEPTHWQPIPSPPSPSSTDAK